MSIATEENRARAGAAPTVGISGDATAPHGATPYPNPAWTQPGAGAPRPAGVQPWATIIVGVCLTVVIGLFAAHSAHVFPFAAHPAVQPQPQQRQSQQHQPQQHQQQQPQQQPQQQQPQLQSQSQSNNLQVPSDITLSTCGNGLSDAQQNGLGNGLVQAVECPEPNVADGQITALVYDSSAASDAALEALNTTVGFDPSTAGSTCSAPGGGVLTEQSGNVECWVGNSANSIVLQAGDGEILWVTTSSDFPTTLQWLQNVQWTNVASN